MSQISKSNNNSNNSIIKHMVACGVLAAFVSMSVEAMPMSTSDDDENSISTKRASIPCVYDSCPEILVTGAGHAPSNGIFKPHGQGCSHPDYGKTSNVNIDMYRNQHGAVAKFYLNNRVQDGWAIYGGDSKNHRYYDGYNRNKISEFPTDGYVGNGYHGPAPVPTISCLTSAGVSWRAVSSNPTTTWSRTETSEYSREEVEAMTIEASVGVEAYGVTASTSYQEMVQTTINNAFSSTDTTTCQNPCGTDHVLYTETIGFGSQSEDMLPQCGKIVCKPFNVAGGPKCPFEYSGGESLFDGCQCCTSLDWAADPSKVDVPICKRGDDFMKMLA